VLLLVRQSPSRLHPISGSALDPCQAAAAAVTAACRDKVLVASKVAGPSAQMTWIRGGPIALDAANITAALDDSLRRLQTDYIDLYQLHWPDRYVTVVFPMCFLAKFSLLSVPLFDCFGGVKTLCQDLRDVLRRAVLCCSAGMYPCLGTSITTHRTLTRHVHRTAQGVPTLRCGLGLGSTLNAAFASFLSWASAYG
jgi:hypothetical protein